MFGETEPKTASRCNTIPPAGQNKGTGLSGLMKSAQSGCQQTLLKRRPLTLPAAQYASTSLNPSGLDWRLKTWTPRTVVRGEFTGKMRQN